jgi:hypothetical protein
VRIGQPLGWCAAFVAISATASCSSPERTFIGHWVSEQSSAIALDLYPDGTATFSSVNMLDLKWKVVEPTWVRVDALGQRMTFNFRLTKDDKGQKGTLQATGFDTLTFRKKG